MTGRLTLLSGRANSGKTQWMFQRLKEYQRQGLRAVLLVPEQYTFETERALSAYMGGLMGVQVLSFERLSERLLSASADPKPFLSAQGYRMIIRRVALLNGSKLRCFGLSYEKSGFAADMAEVFNTLKRAGLTGEDVGALSEKLPENSPLKEKLADIALLYGETEAYLKSRYMTTGDAFNMALSLLPGSFIKDTPVFIDGLEQPGRQVYELIETVMITAKETTVSLRCDDPAASDGELFEPDRRIYRRLTEMASSRGVPVFERRLTGPVVTCEKELSYLEQQLFCCKSKPYAGDAAHIAVYGATDRVAEAEWLGDMVLKEARLGVRFREMAVVVSDMEGYEGLITRAFRRRGIPFFLDRKRPVTGHAAVEAMVAAVGAVAEGYPAGQVLRLAKSGYSGVEHRDAEELELYLVRTGLQGGALKRPFSGKDVPAGAERARGRLMEPLLRLQEGLSGRTVSEKTRALYAYLVDIQLDRQLSERAASLFNCGRVTLMEEHGQVWNMLMALLSQMDAILGDVPAGREVFFKLMKEGLSGYGLGVIPGTADQVLLGDVARTKSRNVHTLFLVGVNDGLLPRPVMNDGLLDDLELKQMEETGAEFFMDSKARAAGNRLDLYTVLARATGALVVSYSFSGEAGELAPSPLIGQLFTLFPSCRRYTGLDTSDELPVGERAGLFALTKALSAFSRDGISGPLLPTLVRYYENHPTYSVRVRHMLEEARGVRPLPPLSREQALLLYGRRIPMSASRLEQFGACPFKHFIRYGLAAMDKRAYTEEATDLGTFYHACMDGFVKRALEERTDWRTVTDEWADAMMDAVLPGVIASHNDGIFLNHHRLRATLFLLVDTVKASARAVGAQLRAGMFTPLGSELRFGEGQPFPPVRLTLSDGTTALLSGVIDRADGADLPGERYLRIVDYKTGERDFDLSAIVHGLSLQLPLYLMAVTGQGQYAHAKPAGMYYMPLRVPVGEEGADQAEKVKDAFRLRGLTLSSPAVLRLSDGQMSGASCVLSGVRAKGEEAYGGSICSEAELGHVLKTAKRAAGKSFKAMLSGSIGVSPAQGACGYCSYRSICRFDPMRRGCRTRKYEKIKLEDFFRAGGGDGYELDQ